MTEITIKLVDGTPFPLLDHYERTLSALHSDGCLLLSGATNASEIDALLVPAAAILRLAGDTTKFWRIDVEGGKSLEARGGDLYSPLSLPQTISDDSLRSIICADARTFEVVSLGTFDDSHAMVRRVIKPPRTYFCPVEGCISSFNRKDNLRRHVRDQHKEFGVEQLDSPMVHSMFAPHPSRQG